MFGFTMKFLCLQVTVNVSLRATYPIILWKKLKRFEINKKITGEQGWRSGDPPTCPGFGDSRTRCHIFSQSAPRGFSPGILRFSPLSKNQNLI